MTENDSITRIEIDLLLESIYRRYGYDFRSYARATIERRVSQFLSKSECGSVSELIPKLLHDEVFFSQLVRYFSIPVTEMFRDPFVYRAVRDQVIPLLRTWPNFKIWHAGCATGEEVYSLAILLKEEGLYNRATIYATDFNDAALERAREGVYQLNQLQKATRNYQLAGGKESFASYYHSQYDAAILDASLRQRIVFANHNLAADSAFGEMQLVFCRNVLIYFNTDLQSRVLGLFTKSLVRGGFLCLGSKERLDFSAAKDYFDPVDIEARLYARNGRK